jgi:hypothetical protein
MAQEAKERKAMVIKASLNFFFNSTQIPKQTDPINPAIINIAPNREAFP